MPPIQAFGLLYLALIKHIKVQNYDPSLPSLFNHSGLAGAVVGVAEYRMLDQSLLGNE